MRTVSLSWGVKGSGLPVRVFVSLSIILTGAEPVRLIPRDANGHDNMGRMKPVLALAVLACVCCTIGAVAALPQDDTLRVSVDLVNVPFTVTDRHGRFVSGLTAKDFLVEEDGRRQEI